MTPGNGGNAEAAGAGVAGSGTEAETARAAGADLPDWVRFMLRCPVTGATLIDGAGPDGAPELHSTDPDRPLAYPVRDGIPVLLESDAREL